MITNYILATNAPMARILHNAHMLCASCTEHVGRVFTDEQSARAALREHREDPGATWSWNARVWVVQSHTQQLPD